MNNERKWKVIHFSTGHEGGAGLAARRLNAALNAAGISSTFWALNNLNYRRNEQEFFIPRSNLTRYVSGIGGFIQSRLSQKVFFSLWSLNVLSIRRINKMANPENTILHFHNWFNLISQNKILQLSKQGFKIVLTLHDERFITGGCHYAYECKGFQDKCQKCPELSGILRAFPSWNLRKTLKNVKEVSDSIVFVSPSRWLRHEALSSSLLSDFPVVFIPNTLGSNHHQVLFLEKTHIPKEISILKVGVASMSKKSYIKGGDLIAKVQEEIMLGQLPIEIIFLSDFDDNDQLPSAFWSHIDYLLVPSRAENSPNVIHEAKSLGIPVIASALGGIPELLTPDFDIPISTQQLNVEGILKILLSIKSQQNQELKNRMQTQFNEYVSQAIQNHIHLYENLIQN